jgi:hypothetical protein
MTSVLIALMVVASLTIVVWPLFRSANKLDVPFGAVDPLREHLATLRDATYAAIKDLELDHAMGKLSDSDYKTLRARYEIKAVTTLQELDNLDRAHRERVAMSETTIEREVEMRRRAKGTKGKLACPRCDTPYSEGDVFCAKCGTALKGTRCTACGRRSMLGDEYCSNCGSPL